MAVQQLLSSYRNHQHKTQSIKEGIHSSSRERDGDCNPEGGKDFRSDHAKGDHKNAELMPNIPTANYDDNPEMIEISSSEDEEEVEVEEPEDEPPSPTARGTRTEQTSGETDTGVMTSKLMMMQKTWGVNLPRPRNAEQKFEVSVINLRKLSQTHQMPDIV